MLPYINLPFEAASSIFGASVDELKLIASFLLSYPLAGLLKRIPDSKPAYKNLFIIGVSLFYLVGLFDLWPGTRTLLISSAGTYLIANYVQGPWMPWVGFVFLMGHMSMNHIIRQSLNDPSIVDITGAQMVLVMKLSAFAWNVADGRLPAEELSDFQKERALKQLPSLLDYAGYVLFFPSLFAGPAFDFVDYKRWIECVMFELPPGVDPSKAAPTKKKRKIPRSGTPAAWKAAAGLTWILIFLKFSALFYPEYLLSDDYMKHGFLYRVFLLYMVGLAMRLKYYGVWTLTEGACILSGLGYKGVDPVTGKVSWDRLRNVDPWVVETAQNTRAYLGGWNMNTNSWLRNYMYLRVTPKGKKPGYRATLATFVTSAFWHGFYPGYYLSFVLASFLQTSAKNCRRYFRPFFISPTTGDPTPSKIYYDIASFIVTQVTFSFAVAPFILLTLPDSLLVWSRVYYYDIILVTLSVAFFASPAKDLFKKAVADRAGRPGLDRTTSQESVGGKEEPLQGVPADPFRDLSEIKQDMEALHKKRMGTDRKDENKKEL